MATILGIDFGASTTCVSVFRDGKPVVVPVPGGSPVVPSYVHLREDGKILIGDGAKAECIADPYSTIWAAKRLIGLPFNDNNVQASLEKLPYLIEAGPCGEIIIRARDKKVTPEWIASVILRFVVNNASRFLGESVNQAVITVPGSFGPEQREALKKAAEKVGVSVVRLLNEPTSAALAWGFHKNADQTIAVFDLGGGTLDISILAIGRGKYHLLASAGDPWLGGEDFDNLIVECVAQDFRKKHGFNIFSDKIALQRLKTAAENAKIELSTAVSSRIHLPEILPDLSRVADVDYTLTREDFERLVAPLAARTIELFRETLDAAKLSPELLDNVILVGGSTKMPYIRRLVAQYIGRQPDCSINPDQAVAMGAAIVAASVAGEQVELRPPVSTRTEEEYLSGDIDLHAMYDEVLRGGAQPAAEPDAYRGWGSGAAAGILNPTTSPDKTMPPSGVSLLGTPVTLGGTAAVAPAPFASLPQLKVDVHSLTISQDDFNRMIVAAGENGATKSPWVTGAFALSPERGEGVKLQVFQPGPAGPVLAGEFIIQSARVAPGSPPHLIVSFNVNKAAPFALKAPTGR